MKTTMKQAWLTAPGGPWERGGSIPKPGPGQMLVKVKMRLYLQTDRQ